MKKKMLMDWKAKLTTVQTSPVLHLASPGNTPLPLSLSLWYFVVWPLVASRLPHHPVPHYPPYPKLLPSLPSFPNTSSVPKRGLYESTDSILNSFATYFHCHWIHFVIIIMHSSRWLGTASSQTIHSILPACSLLSLFPHPIPCLVFFFSLSLCPSFLPHFPILSLIIYLFFSLLFFPYFFYWLSFRLSLPSSRFSILHKPRLFPNICFALYNYFLVPSLLSLFNFFFSLSLFFLFSEFIHPFIHVSSFHHLSSWFFSFFNSSLFCEWLRNKHHFGICKTENVKWKKK